MSELPSGGGPHPPNPRPARVTRPLSGHTSKVNSVCTYSRKSKKSNSDSMCWCVCDLGAHSAPSVHIQKTSPQMCCCNVWILCVSKCIILQIASLSRNGQIKIFYLLCMHRNIFRLGYKRKRSLFKMSSKVRLFIEVCLQAVN